MLEARVQQGALLRRIFDCVKELVTDVNLECVGEGITMQAMDSSHVSLVMLTLNEPFFERYRCDVTRTLGLSLPAVCKVFKLCGGEDAAIIRHVDDSDSVSFTFEGAGEDRLSDFDLKLMMIDAESLGIPDAKFDAVIDMPSKHFARICADFANFSDTITFEISGKEIKFCCKGSLGGGSTTLKPRDGEARDKIQITVVSPLSLSFSIKFLNDFSKASALATQVRLSLSPSAPLEVTFFIDDHSELGSLKYYLAPKMDDMDTEN